MKSRIIIGLALLCVAGAALAATLTASWTAPTKNTDGSNITAPLTYNLYTGATPGSEGATPSQTGLSGTSSPVTVAAGATLCAQLTAVANGLESAHSPEVCASAPFPTPNAPTGLALH